MQEKSNNLRVENQEQAKLVANLQENLAKMSEERNLLKQEAEAKQKELIENLKKNEQELEVLIIQVTQRPIWHHNIHEKTGDVDWWKK